MKMAESIKENKLAETIEAFISVNTTPKLSKFSKDIF